jgi:hypothetical protein
MLQQNKSKSHHSILDAGEVISLLSWQSYAVFHAPRKLAEMKTMSIILVWADVVREGHLRPDSEQLQCSTKALM